MARVPHRETNDRVERERFNREIAQLEQRIAGLERRDGQADSESPDRPGVDYFIWLGFDTGNTQVYLPVQGQVPSAVPGEGWVNWLAPWRCKVVEVVLFNLSTSYGSTTVTTHINENPAVDTAVEDLNVGVDATHFKLGTRVEPGQRLAIGFLATSLGGEVAGYVRIRRVD